MNARAVMFASLAAFAIAVLALGLVIHSSSTAQGGMQGLRGDLDRLGQQLEEVNQSLEGVSAGLEELLRNLEALNQRVSAIEDAARRLEERTGQLEDRVGSVEKGLGELGGSLEEVAGEVRALAESVENLNQGLEALGERVATVEERLRVAGFPLEVSDALGRIVVIPEPPERIVSLAPSVTEILFSIGAGDLVVGVDEYSNYPPEVVELVEAGKLEVVGGFSTISIEKVVELQPDLVVGVGGVQLKVVYALSQLGITALSLESETIGDVFNNILLLGKVTQRMDEAKSLVDELRRGLQEVFAKTSSVGDKPSVLFVVWVNPVFAAGGQSWVSDLIRIAGGENALAGVDEAWPMVGWETILEANPDVIIFTEFAGGLSNATAALEWLAGQPGSMNITAVAEGRVYMLHGDLSDALQRPGVRVAIAAEALARILHPQLYGISQLPNDLYLEDLGLGGEG